MLTKEHFKHAKQAPLARSNAWLSSESPTDWLIVLQFFPMSRPGIWEFEYWTPSEHPTGTRTAKGNWTHVTAPSQNLGLAAGWGSTSQVPCEVPLDGVFTSLTPWSMFWILRERSQIEIERNRTSFQQSSNQMKRSIIPHYSTISVYHYLWTYKGVFPRIHRVKTKEEAALSPTGKVYTLTGKQLLTSISGEDSQYHELLINLQTLWEFILHRGHW